MALRSTPVSRSLDRKLKILGYEIPDVFAIFITLSVLNYLFGGHPLKIYFAWLPTIALAVVIRIVKRGKADNYILHKVRSLFRPRYLCSFSRSRAPKIKKL